MKQSSAWLLSSSVTYVRIYVEVGYCVVRLEFIASAKAYLIA